MDFPSTWSLGVTGVEEPAPRTFFVPAFANAAAFETDEGLLLVDTGVTHSAEAIRDSIRRRSTKPLHTVVFTHGHLDHAFGLTPWLAEAKGAKPRIVAHAKVADRFRRYARTAKLNEHINRVQFGFSQVTWPREPADFAWPDVTYHDKLELMLGGETFELHHGRGESDDATWVWAPARKVVCAGDFWIGCAPNCGNPQKVQRFAEDWADVLDAMVALRPEVLLPGHGPPIVGAEAIRTALTDTSEYLRSIVAQTLEGLNAGLPHEQIVERIRVPEHLADKSYLQPLYDRPEFIARNVIRLHAGWWDGFAANLLPASPDARAKEIADLAGGVDRLVARAREVGKSDLALACHLAEWARLADPRHTGAASAVRDLFSERAMREPSLMARSIFRAAGGRDDPKLR